MANPTTTHVIEIKTGIGEPAFIPLSMGRELQPISVGKKGMWRVESPRVLDVHAFFYFDGALLFLQSADEANAAAVDGFSVGKAWTQLHPPCEIEIGLARLRFRSLIEEESEQAPAAPNPPVRPQSGRPGVASESRPPPGTEQRMPTVRTAREPSPAPFVSSPPITFPKADRSYVGESTRIVPVDARRAATAAMPVHEASTRAAESAAYGPQPTYPPSGAPQGYEPSPPLYGPQRSPNAGASGSFTPQGVRHPAPGGAQSLATKVKQRSVPTIAAGLLLLLCGVLYLSLSRNNDPWTKRSSGSSPDGGATGASGASSAPLGVAPPVLVQAPAPPTWPAGVPCPPPNWPPETPLPCKPNGVAPPATAPRIRDAKEPKEPVGLRAKTLERQAVDCVAAGDATKGAEIYEELARRDPKNKVYAEAARILRAKVGPGPR